ncbi:uncharacterized protein TRAVEDRAFT_162417, partial [Trametes versicolor FP-101664 SS1]|uniref:uncharacterized protein n=1 Tax=Trametes versicolor (strain FP-101664) TaxID=717944 RepID=UPI000462447A
MDSESSETTTTVFVSNMHCGSCVKTIQDALAALSPAPSVVDVSIVTQSVTVKHPRTLSLEDIKSALDTAGYDVLSTPTDKSSSYPPLSWSGSLARLSAFPTSNRMKHFDNCDQ